MSEIINLNKKRKAKAKAVDAARASENRLKHGRTKQEKLAEKRTAEKLELHVKSHQRETSDE